MHQPLLVHVCQGPTEIHQDLLAACPAIVCVLQVAKASDGLVQVLAVHVLHADVGLTVQVSVGIHPDDVRVSNTGECPELSAKALERGTRVQPAAFEDLQGHWILIWIPSQDHIGHASSADFFDVDVGPQASTRNNAGVADLELVCGGLCHRHECNCEHVNGPQVDAFACASFGRTLADYGDLDGWYGL